MRTRLRERQELVELERLRRCYQDVAEKRSLESERMVARARRKRDAADRKALAERKPKPRKRDRSTLNARERHNLSAVPDESWAAKEDAERRVAGLVHGEFEMDVRADGMPRDLQDQIVLSARSRGGFDNHALLALATLH